jgi:glutamate racemase
MNRLIGLLDSGMGGLTSLNQIITSLPEENTVYFGDMGRAPYGSRSPEVINRYSEQVVRYLTENYDLKLIVTACHTVSATSLDHLRQISPVPIVGMIESVPQKALGVTRAGRIGVIGTKSTIQSGVYQKILHDLDAAVKVYAQECPLLIHLVEEGWAKEPAARMIVGEYLANLKHARIDTLILACTHYPILRCTIQDYLGADVVIVDPSVECFEHIKDYLTAEGQLNNNNYAERIYLVTDSPERFRSSGERYLDRKIHQVSLVDIGELESGV